MYINKNTDLKTKTFSLMCCLKKDYPNEEYNFNIFKNKVGVDDSVSIETETQHIYINCSKNMAWGQDQKNGTILILVGEIYNTISNEVEYLLNKYEKENTDFIKYIDGNFSIVIVDKNKDRVLVFTDRMNSHKILEGFFEQQFWISNAILKMPVEKCTVNLTGLAWYLANGSYYNNHTLLKEIKVLDRAKVFSFNGSNVQENTYWKYEFTKEYTNIPEKVLQSDLIEILTESVRKRYKKSKDSKVYLTLTGGYDSTALLGILTDKLNIKDIESFTFTFDTDKKADSDELSAELMAEIKGIKHFISNAYKGNILPVIYENVRLGNAYSPMVGEIDTWMDLKKKVELNKNPMLFTGDVFTYSYTKRGMDEIYKEKDFDILQTSFLFDFSKLNWLEKYLEADIYKDLVEGLNNDLEKVRGRIPRFNDERDRIDFLWFDQKLPHVSLAWKNNYPGSFMDVKIPFIDYSLIDFYTKIATELRYNKNLFISTIKLHFPELLSVNRSQRISFPDWSQMIVSNADRIKELLSEKETALYRYFPKEVILDILNANIANSESKIKNYKTGNKYDDYKSLDSVFRSDESSFFLLRLLQASEFLRCI